jgi:glutathione S-transferase
MTPALYHHSESPCCQKIRLLLAEKELQWTSHYITLERGEQLEPEFLSLNPKGVVPVLVHDDAVITESTVIAEYIEDRFPGHPMMPLDAVGKARVRGWTKQTDEGLHLPRTVALSWPLALCKIYMEKYPTVAAREEYLANIVSPVMREIKRQSFESQYDAPIFRDAVLFFDALCAKMDVQLRATPWLAGDTFTLAEINLVPYMLRLEDLQFSRLWGNRPVLAEWYERIKSRPAWRLGISTWDDPEWKRHMREAGEEASETITAILAKK